MKCIWEVVQATGLTALLGIAHVMIYVALLAWGLTFFGLLWVSFTQWRLCKHRPASLSGRDDS